MQRRFFVGVPILCASDLIPFAYHNLVFDSSKLEMFVGCIVSDVRGDVLLCGVQQGRKYKNDHIYRLFLNSQQNCQMENKKISRITSKNEYKRKLNHIFIT